MKQLNFIEAVSRNVKEGEEKQIDIAKKNGPILKKMLDAKVSVLEGREIQVQVKYDKAEENLIKAVGTNTDNIELWISTKKQAETNLAEVAQELKDTQDSIEWHKEQIKIFETKK